MSRHRIVFMDRDIRTEPPGDARDALVLSLLLECADKNLANEFTRILRSVTTADLKWLDGVKDANNIKGASSAFLRLFILAAKRKDAAALALLKMFTGYVADAIAPQELQELLTKEIQKFSSCGELDYTQREHAAMLAARLRVAIQDE